jgi:hypothetical protein
MTAIAIHDVDLARASGSFYLGLPPLPMTVLGTEIDLKRVPVDSYVVAGTADHICRGRSATEVPSCWGARSARYWHLVSTMSSACCAFRMRQRHMAGWRSGSSLSLGQRPDEGCGSRRHCAHVGPERRFPLVLPSRTAHRDGGRAQDHVPCQHAQPTATARLQRSAAHGCCRPTVVSKVLDHGGGAGAQETVAGTFRVCREAMKSRITG